MKRSPLSEKSLVAILFVLVIVVFSFAQADTDHLEKANLNTYSPPTSSLEPSKTAVSPEAPVVSSLRSSE
jgi:hypothetical protein